MSIEKITTQVVTVPDGQDMVFRNVEGVGPVRPAVVRELVKRELVSRGMIPSRRERRLLKRVRAAPPIPAPGPPIRPRRISERETTDRMAALLLDEYARHRMFPASTLGQYVDDDLTGERLDRDAVREAVANLWVQTQRQQKGAR